MTGRKLRDRQWPGSGHEMACRQAGYRCVAGLDEAGRGAWAGPVVAAAVVLPEDPQALRLLLGQVDDSKRMSAAARERQFDVISAVALAVGTGSVPPAEIDRIGIVPATHQAMRTAIAQLALVPDYLLIDFLTLPAVSQPQLGLPHGDALCLSIAAASVVAKVTRDRYMRAIEGLYSGYGFAAHKGYGTADHRQALGRLGPCPIHRRTFAPVAQLALC